MITRRRTSMVMAGAMTLAVLTAGGPAAAATGLGATNAGGWTSRPALHIARVGAAAATLDGLIVETGGYNTAEDVLVAPTEVRRVGGGGAWHL
jgi:hypothetical protein